MSFWSTVSSYAQAATTAASSLAGEIANELGFENDGNASSQPVAGEAGGKPTVTTYAQTVNKENLFQEISEKDLEWTLPPGQSTENQVFYVTTKNGFAFVQMIHSNIGIWNPTIQFTARYYDRTKNVNTFKSVNMSNFSLSQDRRSCKSDNMSISLDPTTNNKYKINLTHPELVVALEFERVDKGFKVGEGKTFFGENKDTGFVSHKFWPKAKATGTFIVDGALFDVEGDGLFIHAIQGMQPQTIASKWNFVNFQAADASLVMMQFQTTKAYGAIDVNQGSILLDGKLVSVSVDNKVELFDTIQDEETGYHIPQRIQYSWSGVMFETKQPVKVMLEVKATTLLDKIDVLNEVPWFLKKLVQTFVVKPYIYQWLDACKAEIVIEEIQASEGVEAKEGSKRTIDGVCFHELVLISTDTV